MCISIDSENKSRALHRNNNKNSKEILKRCKERENDFRSDLKLNKTLILARLKKKHYSMHIASTRVGLVLLVEKMHYYLMQPLDGMHFFCIHYEKSSTTSIE